MFRAVGFALFTGVVVISVAACGFEDGRRSGHHHHGGASSTQAACTEATTCGACTPLLGCGWCALPNGTGTCTTGPDECAAQEFSWTWDPSGCRVSAEAGVNPSDASLSEEDDAAATDAGADADPDAEVIH